MCTACFKIDRRSFLVTSTSALLLPMVGGCVSAEETSSLNIIPRESWSDVAPNAQPGSIVQYAVSGKPKYVSIHYTVSRARHKRWSTQKLVEFLRDNHIDNKRYGDVAYHFLVTRPGDIYEGRDIAVASASGTYYHSDEELEDARYLENGKLHPSSILDKPKPGHTEGHITVAFKVGYDQNEQILPEIAMAQGAQLVAKLLVEYGLTPKDVRAHREFANSSCPGDTIYRWLRGDTMQRDGIGRGMELIEQEYNRLKRA